MVFGPTALPANPEQPRSVNTTKTSAPVSRVAPIFRSPGDARIAPPPPPIDQEPSRSLTNGTDVFEFSQDALDAAGIGSAPVLEDDFERFVPSNSSSPVLETAPRTSPTPPSAQVAQQNAPAVRTVPLPPPVNNTATTELLRGGNFSILA